MNITVLGAGAMGSLFGARLAESGHPVQLVDVWQEHVDAINAGGLLLEEDGIERRIAVRASTPAGALDRAELVLLFTKAFDSEAALAGAGQILGPETWVLSLQNGIGHADAIRRHVAPVRIALGTTTFPSDLVGPGRVRTRGRGQTRIMSVEGGVGDELRRIAAALDGAGLDCAISERMWEAVWEKLAFNAAVNAIAAVTRLAVGPVGDSPEARALADQVADEVVAVARRQGIAADAGAVKATIAMAFRDHRTHQPSMLQDLLAGRPTEIESINGAAVREAERLGVAAPATTVLYQLVRTLERAHRRT